AFARGLVDVGEGFDRGLELRLRVGHGDAFETGCEEREVVQRVARAQHALMRDALVREQREQRAALVDAPRQNVEEDARRNEGCVARAFDLARGGLGFGAVAVEVREAPAAEY